MGVHSIDMLRLAPPRYSLALDEEGMVDESSVCPIVQKWMLRRRVHGCNFHIDPSKIPMTGKPRVAFDGVMLDGSARLLDRFL